MAILPLPAGNCVLERYSVRVRYPGVDAEKDEARAAYKAAQTVREFLKQKLG